MSSSPSTPSASTSQTVPARPRRSYGWWIALAVVALIALVGYRFGEPIYGTVSFMVGRPYLPGCTTSITKEETTGALWYRILAQKCEAGLTMHYVFVTRAQSMISFLVTPAFMSIDYPVPKSVSKQADRWYFIAIDPPLADGTDIVETFIGPSGVPLTVHVFDKGQRRPTR
jgi:hypothetical protein